MNYLIFHPICALLGLSLRTTYNFMHIATANWAQALLHVNVSTVLHIVNGVQSLNMKIKTVQ